MKWRNFRDSILLFLLISITIVSCKSNKKQKQIQQIDLVSIESQLQDQLNLFTKEKFSIQQIKKKENRGITPDLHSAEFTWLQQPDVSFTVRFLCKENKVNLSKSRFVEAFEQAKQNQDEEK